MKLVTKVYGILVNDKDQILLKRDDLTLPNGDIVPGEDLITTIRRVVEEKTNIPLIDVILFDQESKIEQDHTLGIFFIGNFYRKDRERNNQDYGWYKIKKLERNNLDLFTKFIVEQIIGD